MIRLQEGGLQRYVFGSFPQRGIFHGLFNRRGGHSERAFASLNVGHTVGDDAKKVEANHRAIYRLLDVRAESVVSAQQVHGDTVAIVGPQGGGKVLSETDALISDVSGLFLMLRVADCVPVFFYAPRQRAVGLAHAGWKGTLKRIAAKTAEAMVSAYGCSPQELLVGVGPSIGPCCFEVGPELVEQVRASFQGHDELLSLPQADGKAHLDLWRANALQLKEVGVEHIEVSGICTCCRHDEFYSHRGEGGRTGRLAALIGITEKES